eukprot:COSAG05_NODE_1517_length_4653_cov_48.023496_6_plen_101_part_00
MNLGCDTLKFFPAEANGGVKTLSALASVFGDVNFMPTGGITAANIGGYLALKPVVACGMSPNGRCIYSVGPWSHFVSRPSLVDTRALLIFLRWCICNIIA